MECSLKNNSTALSGAEKYIFSLETNWQISFRTRSLLQAESCTHHLMHEPKARALRRATTFLRRAIWTGRLPKHKTCLHCSQLQRQAFPWIKMLSQVAGSHFLSHPLPTQTQQCSRALAVLQPVHDSTATTRSIHRAQLCSALPPAPRAPPTQAWSEAFLDRLPSDSFMSPIKTALSFRLLVLGGVGVGGNSFEN